MQQQILHFLTNIKVNLAKESTPPPKLIIGDLVQGVMPATNADNLSAAGRRPVTSIEELVVFMTRS